MTWQEYGKVEKDKGEQHHNNVSKRDIFWFRAVIAFLLEGYTIEMKIKEDKDQRKKALVYYESLLTYSQALSSKGFGSHSKHKGVDRAVPTFSDACMAIIKYRINVVRNVRFDHKQSELLAIAKGLKDKADILIAKAMQSPDKTSRPDSLLLGDLENLQLVLASMEQAGRSCFALWRKMLTKMHADTENMSRWNTAEQKHGELYIHTPPDALFEFMKTFFKDTHVAQGWEER